MRPEARFKILPYSISYSCVKGARILRASCLGDSHEAQHAGDPRHHDDGDDPFWLWVNPCGGPSPPCVLLYEPKSRNLEQQHELIIRAIKAIN